MAEYKVNGQINLGWNLSFAATKAVPMIAKRVWDTLENATLFAKEDATAVVGLILTVNNDSTNNGVYRIAAIGANAVLEKVGTDEGYATKDWVENKGYLTEHQDLSDYAKKSDLTIVYKYKGSVASFENLPTEDLSNGDVYNVETTGINYAWVAETGEWDKLGGHEDLSTYENVIEKIYIKSDRDTTTPLTINDKAVTIDLSDINERLDAFGEGKQDKLEAGSSENPHIIWSNDRWTAGKVDINTIVPTENKAENSVLAYDGNKVIWTTVEVQPELPDYTSESADKVLTTKVENGKTKLTWASAGNSTTIEEKEVEEVVVEYTISAGSKSANVYSKEGVDQLLSWEQL